MSSPTSATYAYCAVRHPTKPSLRGLGDGLPGLSSTRALSVKKGVWLVVADAPLSTYGEAPLAEGLKNLNWVSECALAHERVVEHFRGASSLVPFKLFTLFLDDKRALAHAQDNLALLESALTRVKDREEYGVRLTLDARAAMRAARERNVERITSGRHYLLAKKGAKDAARQLSSRAATVADSLFGLLAKRAVDARRRPPLNNTALGGRLLLDAAFLVPKKRASAFRSLVAKQAATLWRDGLEVALTGPWPPYNFIAGEA